MQKAPIDEAVLSLLVCPACHAGLTLTNPETVVCSGCGRRYPIRDGLPVLLISAEQQ